MPLIKALFKNVPALVLLIGAVVLLQNHAMNWWMQYDQATGWLWSLVIEAGAIWLWSAKNGLRNGIAVFATALALIAPLYDLAEPVLDQQRSAEQATTTLPQRTQAARERIASLEASLAMYNANSQTRAGWYELIANTQQQLTQARDNLAHLQNESATAAPAALSLYLPLAMQMLALCILQCLVVLTTRTLFSHSKPNTAAPAAGDVSAAGSGADSHPKSRRHSEKPAKPNAAKTRLRAAA